MDYFKKRGWDDELASWWTNFFWLTTVLYGAELTGLLKEFYLGNIDSVEKLKMVTFSILAIIGRSAISALLTALLPKLFPPRSSKKV